MQRPSVFMRVLKEVSEMHEKASSCLYVRLPHENGEQIITKFGTGEVLLKSTYTFQFWFKSPNNNRHLPRRPIRVSARGNDAAKFKATLTPT
jgi:hypothetical protein